MLPPDETKFLCINIDLSSANEFTPWDLQYAVNDGWELVCIDRGVAYMKRVVRSEEPDSDTTGVPEH